MARINICHTAPTTFVVDEVTGGNKKPSRILLHDGSSYDSIGRFSDADHQISHDPDTLDLAFQHIPGP